MGPYQPEGFEQTLSDEYLVRFHFRPQHLAEGSHEYAEMALSLERSKSTLKPLAHNLVQFAYHWTLTAIQYQLCSQAVYSMLEV